MFPDKKRIHSLYFLVDILLIFVAFYLPYRYNSDIIPQNIAGFQAYTTIFCLWAIALIFTLNMQDLYSTDRWLTVAAEWGLVSRCVALSAVVAGLSIFMLKMSVFSRLVFAESGALLIVLLGLWRTAKRMYVRRLIKKGHLVHHVLVVGAGKIGHMLSEQIKDNPHWGKKVIGFLDDNKTGSLNGYAIMGKISDLEEVVRKSFVDEIYITIPSERNITSKIITQALRLKKAVLIVAEHFGLPYRRMKMQYVGFVPLITYVENKTFGVRLGLKRCLDLLVAAFLLILLSPFFLLISFLIRLETSGPVLYISKRCGRKGKVFNFYKFRSMVHNAESMKSLLRPQSEVAGPIFKMRADPRMTRVGRCLRKYSLDEIPQLINVLKGDMSLVGPRPFPVEESERIEYKHIMRLDIKPGMTGLAQIKGRSELSFSRWMRWDSWYVNNWTLGLDMMILWWTIPAVIKGKGAY